MDQTSSSGQSLSESVFDYIILGAGSFSCLLCSNLSAMGYSVLMLTKTDLGEGAQMSERRHPINIPHYFSSSSKQVQQNVYHLYEKAPIYAMRKRFLVSNSGLSHLIAKLKLMKYEKQIKLNTEWKHYTIKPEEWATKEPNLKLSLIKETESIATFEINEQALCLEWARLAASNGAMILNYTKPTHRVFESDNHVLTCIDQTNSQEFKIRGKEIIVNRKGAYLEAIQVNCSPQSILDQQIWHYLQVKKDALDIKQNHLISMDKIGFIASSSFDSVSLGYTQEGIGKDEASKECLKMCNELFGSALDESDILHQWQVVRQHQENKPAINLIEGKINLLDEPDLEFAGIKIKEALQCLTQKEEPNQNWESCLFENPSTFAIVERCDRKFDEAKQTDIKPPLFKQLFYRYGHKMEQITEYAYEYHRRYEPTEVWLRAEVRFCAEYEWCKHADDFFKRRSAVLYDNAQQQALWPAVTEEIEKTKQHLRL